MSENILRNKTKREKKDREREIEMSGKGLLGIGKERKR